MVDEEVRTVLTRIATVGIGNPTAADNLLWSWIGRDRTPEGEAKMRQMARLTPRMTAEALTRSGWAEPGIYAPNTDDLPADVQAATLAIARHLSGEPLVADEIIKAYITENGLQGLWAVGVAGLRLLSNELADQRRGRATPR